MQQISPPVKYDIIKDVLCKTNQCLIIIISISWLDISVHTLVWISFRFEIHWQLLSMLTLPRNTKLGLLPFNANFQTGIVWVFWKCFEFCKSLGYSSGIQLSDCDKKKDPFDHPMWSQVILWVSVPVSPLFAHTFLLVYSFQNISPIIFPQSSTSWSFFNAELPEDFKTGITFKIWAKIEGEY